MALENGGVPYTSEQLEAVKGLWTERLAWQTSSILRTAFLAMTLEERGIPGIIEALHGPTCETVTTLLRQSEEREPYQEEIQTIRMAAEWTVLAIRKSWRRLEWYELAGVGAVRDALLNDESRYFPQGREGIQLLSDELVPFSTRVPLAALQNYTDVSV